ncbi:MAG: ABC-F family ATP-binding cassette domain-containing protein, partial [Gemmatimonadota bacterium]|nr:ABC-F family ATP-binding cassette domain-containing protein [Gemmatimonadota bacterium]
LSNVGVEFGANRIFSGVTFTVSAGDRWGILGRNGTGKTSLFKLILGEFKPTDGVISRQPGLKTTVLEQHRDFGGAKTVWEAGAGEFAELLALEKSLEEQATALGNAGDSPTPQMLAKYDRDFERFEREGGYTFAPKVDAVLEGLGFDPVVSRTRPVEHLSGGERGRLGLARQLVSTADVLMLDEPTNHLDLETTRWLEEYLKSFSKTVLLISHDRSFLANVVDHVLHFEGGSASEYNGGYTSFVQQREERRLTQARAFDKNRKIISAEEDYIRRNLAGQNTKQAKGRRKKLARMPRLSAPIGDEAVMALRLEIGERGGDQVAVAKSVSIGVEGRPLIENFSAVIQRGDIVGFIGPNGAGKSTLLRALAGQREVDDGELRVGNSITFEYYRQDMAQIPMTRTLYEIISDLRPRWERRMVQGHLGKFGFSGDESQRRPESLSGGERARVALAMLVLSKANFLIFDEPTNHLDIESIEALEEALESYEGTILLVSHDRALLEALTTRVWVLHNKHVTDFGGSFEEWEEQSRERTHAANVAAAEEESLRRVHEKQATRKKKSSADDAKLGEREKRRAAEAAERDVAQLEEKVREITSQLADPELYVSPGGIERSATLGKELDKIKSKLDRAIDIWSTLAAG